MLQNITESIQEDTKKVDIFSDSSPYFDSRFIHLAYANQFIQRTPSHSIRNEYGWPTVKAPATDMLICKHIDDKHVLGTLSQWYPKYAIFDIDGHHGKPKSLDDIQRIHNNIGLNASNSITYETSPGSYHSIWRPQYDGKPATVKLVHQLLKAAIKEQGIELYPRENKVVRAPFHPACRIVFRKDLHDICDKMEAFIRLQPIELSAFGKMRKSKNCSASIPTAKKGVFKEAAELYENGLTTYSSRYEAQHKVALHLWRQNLTPEQALEELFDWVITKHNGFSNDANAINAGDHRTETQVRREHESLVGYIWSTFEHYKWYPSSTFNGHYGWLTKQDLVTAAKVSGGNIPHFKFMSQLIAFFNAQRKMRMNVHRSKLQDFCGRAGSTTHKNNYLAHIEWAEQSGLLTREKAYLAGEFSKTIKLAVEPSFTAFEDSRTLTDGLGQALTLEESIDEIGRREAYQILVQNGTTASSASHFLTKLKV